MNLSPVLRVSLALFLLALVITTLVYQIPVSPTIDVGSGRDSPFVQGLSFRENFDGGDFRWSSAAAEIRLWGVGAQAGELRVRLAVPPQSAPVRLAANDRLLGELGATAGFQDVRFPLSASDVGASGNLVVMLTSNTFTAPPDTRPLGVQVDAAQFVGYGAPVIPSPRALLFLPALVLLALAIGQSWSGSRVVGTVAALGALLGGAVGLVVARVETAYFLAPLFELGVLLLVGALALTEGLRRLTGAMQAPPLTARTVRLLFVVLVGAFALRMLLAVGPGYIVDVQDYVVWSYKTVTYGLGSMYSAINGLWISDQSPGLNYVLHIMGLVYRSIFAPDFLYPVVAGDPALRGLTTNPAALADPVQRTLVRLPMPLADVLTGALIFTAARKYVSERGAWLVALAFLFNPAVLWNGSYWGQTDALHSFLVLAAFLLIIFPKRIGWAFFIFGIAFFTKPQAMIFGPLLLLAAYRVGALRGAVRGLAFGGLGAALILAPVAVLGGSEGMLAYFLDTVGHHPILSANAHNLWWFVFRGSIDVIDTRLLVSNTPLTYRVFSILLFGVVYLAILLRARRAPLAEVFGLGAYVAYAFFILPTEIHENYGYALVPLLAVAMARDRSWAAFYIAVGITMTLNYALHDPTLAARLGVSNPDVEWADWRWLNSLANMLIFTVWSVYLLVGRGLTVWKSDLAKMREMPQ